jgi:hypothetical protein
MLAVKYWAGLSHTKLVNVSNLEHDLKTPAAKLLNRDLLQAAITVLKNNNTILPVRELDKVRIASVSFGRKQVTPFQKTLSLYTQVDHFLVPHDASQPYLDSLMTRLKDYNQVIAGIHDDPGRPLNRVTFSQPVMSIISALAARENVIVAVFKNPYVLDKLNSIEEADGLIVTYQDNNDAEDLTAQLIFGGISSSGRLPVRIGNKFPGVRGKR